MQRSIAMLLFLLVGGFATALLPRAMAGTDDPIGKFFYNGDSIAWGLEFTVESVNPDRTLKISDSMQRHRGIWSDVSLSGFLDPEGVIHIPNWADLTLKRRDNESWDAHWGGVRGVLEIE